MIYHTLTTSLALFQINRNRDQYELERQRRKAFWLTIGIVFWTGVATLIWILA